MSDTTKRFGDLHPLLQSTIIETLRAEKARAMANDLRNAWTAMALTASLVGVPGVNGDHDVMSDVMGSVGSAGMAGSMASAQHLATAFDVAIAELQRAAEPT